MVDLLDPAAWTGIVQNTWTDMQTPGFWLAVLQIIWIDILLAGDNAVVIALACRGLPPHLRVWGMVLGAGVAVAMRIAFALVVSSLMMLPYLKLIGGLALLWIAVKLLTPEEESHHENIESSERLWRAVRIVALADLVMSLDNVIAIAAVAKGNAMLLVFGLVVSVPLIIAGAAIVMALLTRFPILVWAGAALLGWIAGEVIAADPALVPLIVQAFGEDALHTVQIVLGLLMAAFVIAAGWMVRRRAARESELA
jgi:YjbE family integral membrane protein